MRNCLHCGMEFAGRPVTVEAVDGEFCCRGCLEVYRLVSDRD